MNAPFSDFELALAAARLDFHERVGFSHIHAFLSFVRAHRLDLNQIAGLVGGYGVLPIVDCGGGRFDLTGDNGEIGFVLEALSEDGESVVDLVGWPLDAPDRVLSAFGRVGLLGAAEAVNPATYFMGGVLEVHKTPLAWLQPGCRGAAIVTRHIAARQLLDAPGPVLAVDEMHGRELLALADSVNDRKKFLVPNRKIAA